MSREPIHIIESHTGGEPTRIVVSGAPDLGNAPLSERAKILRSQHDWLRRAICNEPRGHDAMVGALLCEAHEPDCVCGAIFFNNVSTLGMCIHGTIGLTVTLAHLGRIGPGTHRIDTPVGVVLTTLHEDGSVEVSNVPCFRVAADVPVEVPGWGRVTGDIAWGGNWFFLIDQQGPAVEFRNIEALTAFEDLESKILEKAGHSGLGDWIEFDEESQRFRVKQEMEERLFYHECYDEFRNESFWDELAVRLADRDLARAIGHEAWEALSEEERRARTAAWEKRYWEEFTKHGVERVVVITPPGEG